MVVAASMNDVVSKPENAGHRLGHQLYLCGTHVLFSPIPLICLDLSCLTATVALVNV